MAVKGEGGGGEGRSVSLDVARLRALAIQAARELHYRADGYEVEAPLNNIVPESFHVGRFETCLHSDCVLVRAALPAADPQPKEPVLRVREIELSRETRDHIALNLAIGNHAANHPGEFEACGERACVIARSAADPQPEKD